MLLFESNRSNFLKIFETHQFKGLISFTDVLKICSSLQIFPDLIDSQEIQKIFASVSSGNFFKITFLEFESFIKSVAVKIFANAGDFADSFELFLAHIKSPAFKAYGTEVKALLGKRRSLSKALKSSKQLSLNSVKNKSAAKIPETTRNLSKKQFLDLVNPGISKFKKKKLRKIKEDLMGASVRGRVKKLIEEFRNQDLGQKIVGRKKIADCLELKKVYEDRKILVRLYFVMWKLVAG